MCDTINDITEMSPKGIAKFLFSDDPKDINSFNILPYSQRYDNDAASFNFEILVTIYLEAFMHIIDIKKSHENESEYLLYENMSLDDLMFPNEWFKSMGYSLHVKEYMLDNSQTNLQFVNNVARFAYCRIILSFDKRDMLAFIERNISERYHFILNKTYKKTDKIEEIYAIVNKENKAYKISFQELKIIKNDKQELLQEQRDYKLI